MVVANSSTILSFQASTFQAQGDTANGQSLTLFQLGTDYLDVSFDNLEVVTAGGSVMSIGNGGGGVVAISRLGLGTRVAGSALGGWSQLVPSSVAFFAGAGSSVAFGLRHVISTGTPGAFNAGTGTYALGTSY